MTIAAERIKAEIGNLSREEQAELAHFLLLTLDEGRDEDTEQAWDRELTRRAGEIRSGQASGQPADQVFAHLREKHV